jgi:chemotaxis family two-component system response regulator Rcp1
MPIQVLLIEDNRPDAVLVGHALRKQRLDIALHDFDDGEAAAAYVQRMGGADVPCPDVVIMDLNLPRGDGFALLKQIRDRPGCADTPAIVMTSSVSPHDRARAAAMGNTRYFIKPSDLDAFLQIGVLVREVLKAGSSPPG